jgi:hypothetical protein
MSRRGRGVGEGHARRSAGDGSLKRKNVLLRFIVVILFVLVKVISLGEKFLLRQIAEVGDAGCGGVGASAAGRGDGPG